MIDVFVASLRHEKRREIAARKGVLPSDRRSQHAGGAAVAGRQQQVGGDDGLWYARLQLTVSTLY